MNRNTFPFIKLKLTRGTFLYHKNFTVTIFVVLLLKKRARESPKPSGRQTSRKRENTKYSSTDLIFVKLLMDCSMQTDVYKRQVDDAASSVYFPMYTSSTEVPFAFAEGNGSMMEFTNKAAFWVFNQVTNFAYTRYNLIHPEIRAKQVALEKQYVNFVQMIDAGAKEM